MSNKYALASVANKKDIVSIGRALHKHRYIILSTSGTMNILRSNGVPVTEVSVFTGMAESPGGMLKTLNHKIQGGWLVNNPSNPEFVEYMSQEGIYPIDIVVGNLYEFQKIISQSDVTLERAIENIDIGGPTNIRGAAKSALMFESSVPIVDPGDYQVVIACLEKHGEILPELKRYLAAKVFRVTKEYDSAISLYLDANVKEASKNPWEIINGK